MKRLIVCSDGTWNTPDQEDNGVPAPTNVFKLYNAIADTDGTIRQLKYYHPGVGGKGGFIDSIAGGAVGLGISQHIRSAYHWLATHFEKGDEIFVFGFSRGAFTARSLGGLLGRGLLDLSEVSPKESWRRVEKAYKAYKKRRSTLEDRDWAGDWKFFHGKGPCPVRFIGVWDTVGALGVPDDLEVLNFFDRKRNWEFHDTELGRHVQTARHAMALDEMRSSFSITRWSNVDAHPDMTELWFPGVHSDVGGGYSATDLSDGALDWMIGEAEAAKLGFRTAARKSPKPDPLGVLHNSYKGAFAKLRSRPRRIDAMVTANQARFHPSALKRQKTSPLAYPPYHPTRILDIGQSHSVDVFADTRWSSTGLYLEKGHRYLFSATGEWLDSKDACDWKGTQDGKLTRGDIVRGASSFFGKFETLFEKATGNESTDFLGTKRVEELNWFILVGAIANDQGAGSVVKNDGSPRPHQYVALPDHEDQPFEVEEPGYLYCFPNDVWTLYENNHGSVRLTVKRVG